MPDYAGYENPWTAAARTVSGMSDPIFDLFVKVPHLRAELAMSGQRLALQQREEQRLQTQMEAHLPLLKSQTEQNVAQTAMLKSKVADAEIGNNLMQRTARLAGMQGLDQGGLMRMLQDPESGLQMRQDLTDANVIPKGEFTARPDEFMGLIRAALGGSQQGVIGQSPTATERLLRPPGGAQTFSLSPGQTRFNMGGEPIASLPPDPKALKPVRGSQEQHILNVLKAAMTGTIDQSEIPAYLSQTNLLPGASSPNNASPVATTPIVKQAAQPLSDKRQFTPEPGFVEDGYEFVGGNPADPKSWKRVSQ